MEWYDSKIKLFGNRIGGFSFPMDNKGVVFVKMIDTQRLLTPFQMLYLFIKCKGNIVEVDIDDEKKIGYVRFEKEEEAQYAMKNVDNDYFYCGRNLDSIESDCLEKDKINTLNKLQFKINHLSIELRKNKQELRKQFEYYIYDKITSNPLFRSILSFPFTIRIPPTPKNGYYNKEIEFILFMPSKEKEKEKENQKISIQYMKSVNYEVMDIMTRNMDKSERIQQELSRSIELRLDNGGNNIKFPMHINEKIHALFFRNDEKSIDMESCVSCMEKSRGCDPFINLCSR